jgi:hypothetical protein
MAIFTWAFGLVSVVLLVAKTSAQVPKIVLTAQNFGCPLVDLNGDNLIETQPGPFTIFCLYPNNLLCPYSTDFGGGSTIAGCPAQGYLKCRGCQPRVLDGSMPLVCPLVGPGQALLTHGQRSPNSSITCKYGPSVKCTYTQDGDVTPTSNADCPQAANQIPVAACPTTTARARPSCTP